VTGATFDTGMLVALDRNEREAWVVLRRLVNRREVPTVPTVVTAQAWRDGQRQARLGRALGDCPEILSDEFARKAGELCRRSRTADIVDAVVVESAAAAAMTSTQATPPTSSGSPNTSPTRSPSSRFGR
jgi:hypothetical protein